MSVTLILYKWRIYCSTDSKYEYIWLDENQGEPTLCPANSSHTIDASQNRIVETRNPSSVTISEESVATGGKYACACLKFTAPGNTITSESISFPMIISVLNGQLAVSSDMIGDSIVWTVAPNTTVGALTANANIGDTVLNVSSTVTDNIQIGFDVTLTDGVNTDECGPVVAVDSVNGTITVQTALLYNFSAVSPTYVQMTIKYVDIELAIEGYFVIAGHKIGSASLPSNVPITCYYNNTTMNSKRVVAYIEYLY